MKRPLCVFSAAFLVIFVLSAGGAGADLRTKPIRLVHEMTWEAAPTTIVVHGVNNSDHEKAQEFFDAVQGWIEEGFKKIDYTVGKSGDVNFEWTLDIYDPGSAAKRWGVGFGAGTAHAQGRVTVRQGGKVVGKYEWSARPKGVKGAKEVGPILALKVHQGGRDESLHEYEKATKAEKEAEKKGGGRR